MAHLLARVVASAGCRGCGSLRQGMVTGMGVRWRSPGGGGVGSIAVGFGDSVISRRALSNIAEHLEAFEGFVGSAGVIVDGETLARHNTDWTHAFHGAAEVALRPASTEQVSAVLEYCSSRGISVVPQGGNTGLVGGSVPCGNEVLLLMGAMDNVVGFDTHGSIVTCEAGIVLENLESWAAERGLTVPLDLGAKGSCQIGGNVATNAGGLRYLRYGSLRGSVVGMEVVLGDGRVISDLRGLKKDNTGYSLRQMFIGSEGTLGVITKLALSLAPRSTSTQVAILACPSFDAVLSAHALARSRISDILSACEFFDAQSLELTLAQFPDVARNPFSDDHPFYMLVETRGSNGDHDAEKLGDFLAEACEPAAEGGKGEGECAVAVVTDCVVAQSMQQEQALWFLRENITLALKQRGYTHKYDMSLRLPKMYELVQETRRRLADKCQSDDDVLVCGYGHLGDGNLHLNVSTPGPREHPSVAAALEPFVYEWTASNGGSISAEHGIGQLKQKYLPLNRTEVELALMKQDLMDPAGILNPGKMLGGAAP